MKRLRAIAEFDELGSGFALAMRDLEIRGSGNILGAEQSGHIVCGAEHHYIGDGTYTALRVLAALREEGAPLSELAAPYRPFPQVLLNVPVTRKPDLEAIPAVREAVRSVEDAWGEDGRVLLRYSGTEPLARVMVEGPDEERIRSQAQELAAHYRAEFASPYLAAARGYITDVIEPSETRWMVALALRKTLSKREVRPPKKHGNNPM